MVWTGFGSLESKAARRRWPLSLGHGVGVSLMPGPTIVSEVGATWATTLRPSSGPLAEYGTSPGRMPDKPARRDQPLQPLTLQVVAVGASPPPDPLPPPPAPGSPTLGMEPHGECCWTQARGRHPPHPLSAPGATFEPLLPLGQPKWPAFS